MAWRRSRQKVSSSSPSRPSVVRAAALHLSSLHAGRLQTGRLRPHLQSERKQLFKPRPVCRQFVVYSESFTQAGEIKQGAGHRRTPAHVKPSSAAQSSVTCGEIKTANGLKNTLRLHLCLSSSWSTSYRPPRAAWTNAGSRYMILNTLRPSMSLVRGQVAMQTRHLTEGLDPIASIFCTPPPPSTCERATATQTENFLLSTEGRMRGFLKASSRRCCCSAHDLRTRGSACSRPAALATHGRQNYKQSGVVLERTII